MPSHDAHIHRILDHLDAGKPVSQRSLSGELGIALGLTNLLVRRMMHNGWVQLVRVPSNRYRYFLTPAGFAEKARRARAHFGHSVQFYVQMRERIRQAFDTVSAQWDESEGGGATKQIVFFGGGEIAEIGYVCLQGSDLQLTAVVDDARQGAFFNIPVHPVSALKGGKVAGQPFGALIVMSFTDTSGIEAILTKRRVPANRIVWLA